MDEEKLKPCPFCGSNNIEIIPYWSSHRRKRVEGRAIKCKNCLFEKTQLAMRYSLEWLEERLIEDWNKREGEKQERNKIIELLKERINDTKGLIANDTYVSFLAEIEDME